MSVSGPARGRIDLLGVTLTFGSAPLFAGLNLAIEPGAFVCLLGPSGVGKSTLLRAIAGLVPLAAGAIYLDGRAALMAQDDALMPWARPLANVTLGDRLRGLGADEARARELLRSVGLDGRDERPAAMSGGMRKRVALARLLYEDCSVALLDEPFAALDAITRRSVQALTRRLLVDRTVVMVTHDPAEALTVADRLVVLAGAPARVVLDEAPPKAPPGTVRDPYDPSLRDLHQQMLSALDTAVAA
ncbi:MAG: ABC transporter ATP-binding protein [Alphaproteobacteria bacterium]|nr:ABC transporter ATP-binding protein [Alphaproteobacteria bacterium]